MYPQHCKQSSKPPLHLSLIIVGSRWLGSSQKLPVYFGNPSGKDNLLTLSRTLSHFPHGPTASFSLHNVVLRHDIPNSIRGTVSESYPHLIFDGNETKFIYVLCWHVLTLDPGFTTRLGERVVKILKHIFPPREPVTSKAKLGNRVVTFKRYVVIIQFILFADC